MQKTIKKKKKKIKEKKSNAWMMPRHVCKLLCLDPVIKSYEKIYSCHSKYK